MEQFSARPMRIAASTAEPLTTGSAPGRPRHTGHTCEFGAAPNVVGQPQNIFVAVESSTWASSPRTGSYVRSASPYSGSAPLVTSVVMRTPRGQGHDPAAGHPTGRATRPPVHRRPDRAGRRPAEAP